MAKQTAKQKRSGNSWTAKRRPMGMTPAIIAAVGIAAILLCWLAEAGLGDMLAPSASAAPVLRISEVMTSESTARVGANALAADWIEIENTSGQTVELTGYVLMRETKPAQAFAFPRGAIAPGEYVVVICDGSGQPLQDDGYHAPFRLPSSGELLSLLDKRGAEVDQLELPALSKDQVYCRDAQGAWQVSDTATPGTANVVERLDGTGEVRDVQLVEGPLEISEVMPKNATFFPDETGEYPDYLEIHNTSSSPVNLANWCLSDDRARLGRWKFPAVTLPADGYLAVHCSGRDDKSDSAHLHAPFKLSRDGEDVYLTNPNGGTVSHVKVPALEADQAYTLIETGWTDSFAPTPNQPNNVYGADAAAEAIRAKNAYGVYITEILASSDKSDDWIELYNTSAQAVDLSGFGLSDNAARPRKWQFPQGTVIQPGAYLGVFANGKDAVDGNRIQTNYRLSADGGYSVVLSEPNGNIFDRLFVPAQYRNLSYGRAEGQQALRYFATVTPGAANSSDAYLGKAPLPVYSVKGGLYHTGDVLSVEMKVPSNCRIYYTLDNTDPDQNDTLYTSPISVTGTTILRTRVYGDGYLDSFMDAQSYLFDVNNGDGTVFVMSLVSDPYNLTSDEHGIMVKGPNAWPKSPYGAMNQGANFWMDWEVEAHIEVFNPDGSTLISQECGTKLHGQYSRKEDQKAFKVIARSEYGGKNRFDAAIFSKRPYTEYQSFLMRACGQDVKHTRMRDAVMQSLNEGTSVLYQETEVGVLYIDGQYWGHYNLRERINPASICQFEGWEGDEDNIDLIKANTNVMQGSNDTMAKLLDWIKGRDMNTEEAYQVLDQAIDIQNYIEYMATEMFTGNTDTLNVKRYRNSNADGKWRWVLFDLDWAFYEDTNSVRRWLTPGGMGNANRTDNSLFIACMKNDTFRDRFLTYLGEKMATTYSTESVLARIEAFYNRIKPLLPDQFARWGGSESEYAADMKKLINYTKSRPKRMFQFLKYCEYLPLTQAQMEHYFGEAMAVAGVTYDELKDPR